MRGRRTSDEKIKAARDLREKGFSVREIAKRLSDVSKSAVQRFTEDVPMEPPPQQPETEEPPEAPLEVRGTLPSRWESEMADLWGQLLDIQSAADFASYDGDADALRKLESELARLPQKGEDFFKSVPFSRFGRRIDR